MKERKKEDLPLMERHFMSALSAVCCLEAVYAPPFIPRITPAATHPNPLHY